MDEPPEDQKMAAVASMGASIRRKARDKKGKQMNVKIGLRVKAKKCDRPTVLLARINVQI